MKNKVIKANETPGSTGELIMAVAISFAAMSNSPSLPQSQSYPSESSKNYPSAMPPGSYDSYTDRLAESSTSNMIFENIISELYTKLTESQEDLGQAFKNVYFENAWDLYES